MRRVGRRRLRVRVARAKNLTNSRRNIPKRDPQRA
jgi:hypothetical protein